MTQPHYPESNDKVFGVWDIAAFLLENRKTIAVFIAGTVCAAVVLSSAGDADVRGYDQHHHRPHPGGGTIQCNVDASDDDVGPVAR